LARRGSVRDSSSKKHPKLSNRSDIIITDEAHRSQYDTFALNMRSALPNAAFLEKFRQMIDKYNAGSINLEEFFAQLISFAQRLNEEEKRGIAENLSKEELALFDILTKPEPRLRKSEEIQVKKIARELLGALKREKLVLDWWKRQQTRQAVRVCIEEVLDRLPPLDSPDLYRTKCELACRHVYDSYFGEGKSVYAST